MKSDNLIHLNGVKLGSLILAMNKEIKTNSQEKQIVLLNLTSDMTDFSQYLDKWHVLMELIFLIVKNVNDVQVVSNLINTSVSEGKDRQDIGKLFPVALKLKTPDDASQIMKKIKFLIDNLLFSPILLMYDPSSASILLSP